MGKRLIFCRVDDEYLRGAGQLAGAVGSHDDVYLRIQFGGMWAGMTRYVTFKDALGENPTKVWLLPSLLVEDEPEVYDVPIPESAKAVRGNMMVTVTGYSSDTEGKQEESVTNTVTAYFKILDSDAADGEDASVTLTLAQQVALMLDRFNAAEKVRVTQEAGRVEAEEARVAAEQARADEHTGTIAQAREAAKTEADRAERMAQRAADSAEASAASAGEARGEAARAKESREAVENMTVSAEELPAGQAATVKKTVSGGAVNLRFGIPAGADGEDGKSAYQAAVEGGYTGTEAEFYAALAASGDCLPLDNKEKQKSVSGFFQVVDKSLTPDPYFTVYTSNADSPTGHAINFWRSIAINEPIYSATYANGTYTTSLFLDPETKSGHFTNVFADTLSCKTISGDFDDPDIPINFYDPIKVETIYSKSIIPRSGNVHNLGSDPTRFNTLFTKKVDASEFVESAKIQAPNTIDKLRFTCRSAATPVESPDPLPPAWGGNVPDNPVVNGDFRHVVNQQGLIVYNKTGRTIDAWFSSSPDITVTVNDEYITITNAASSHNLWYQFLDEWKSYFGKKVTVSALVRSHNNLPTRCKVALYAIGPNVVYPEQSITSSIVDIPVGDDWILIKNTVTLPALTNETDLRVLVYPRFPGTPADGVRGIDIMGVKIDPGPKQTLAYLDTNGKWQMTKFLPDYQRELKRCQERYFYNAINDDADNFFSDCTITGCIRKRSASGTSTHELKMFIPLPVTMRKDLVFVKLKDQNYIIYDGSKSLYDADEFCIVETPNVYRARNGIYIEGFCKAKNNENPLPDYKYGQIMISLSSEYGSGFALDAE